MASVGSMSNNATRNRTIQSKIKSFSFEMKDFHCDVSNECRWNDLEVRLRHPIQFDTAWIRVDTSFLIINENEIEFNFLDLLNKDFLDIFYIFIIWSYIDRMQMQMSEEKNWKNQFFRLDQQVFPKFIER